MDILFIHVTTGQFRHLARRIAQNKKQRVIFLTARKMQRRMPGVDIEYTNATEVVALTRTTI